MLITICLFRLAGSSVIRVSSFSSIHSPITRVVSSRCWHISFFVNRILSCRFLIRSGIDITTTSSFCKKVLCSPCSNGDELIHNISPSLLYYRL
jgi:hypothetical protein